MSPAIRTRRCLCKCLKGQEMREGTIATTRAVVAIWKQCSDRNDPIDPGNGAHR